MTDDVRFEVSSGVLVAPFRDTAIAADLATNRTHVLSRVAAWLLNQDVRVDVDVLASDLPQEARANVVRDIERTVDALRSLGLVDRVEPYDFPKEPGRGGGPTRGAHVGLVHAVVDHRIAFRHDDPEVLHAIDDLLGDGIDDSADRMFDLVDDGDGGFTLYAADQWHFVNREVLLLQLPSVLNDDGARTHGLPVLHAGAVRAPDGRLVVVTGPPDAGKSTLVAALVAAGCDYLGDEAIGVAPDGSLLGYPKPLTLSAESRRVLGLPPAKFPHLRPAELRDDVVSLARAPRVDEILLVTYDPDLTHPIRSGPLDPTAALEAILGNVLNLARAGEAGLESICRLVETVPVRPFAHPGVDAAVPVILGG